MTLSKNGTIPIMNKLFLSLAGALTAAVGSPMPSDLREYIWTVLSFTAVDTALGVYVAWRFREIESRKFIVKLEDKGVLFLVIGLLGYAGAALVDSWLVCKGAAGGLVFYEFLSIVESFKKLARNEKQGRLLVSIIEKLGKGFLDKTDVAAVAVQQTETQTHQTTVNMTVHKEGQ